jgi:hypothetical protein
MPPAPANRPAMPPAPANRPAAIALFSSGIALVLLLVVLVSYEEPVGPAVYLGSAGLALVAIVCAVLGIRPARRGARPGIFAVAAALILSAPPAVVLGTDIAERVGELGWDRAVPPSRLVALERVTDVPVYSLGLVHGDVVLDRVSRGFFEPGNPVPGLIFLHYSGRCSLPSRLFPEFWRCGQELEIEVRDVCSAWERPRGERLMVRGVPADLGPTAGRLWLWTDRSRIQILRLAGGPGLDVVGVAEGLRGVNVEVGVEDDLPPPAWDPWAEERPRDC